MSATAEEYSQRLADGLCGSCGNHPTRDGLVQCDACAKKSADRQAELRRLGLCARCKGKALPGLANCAVCRDKMKNYLVERRVERAKAGVCVRCRAKLDGKGITCKRCAALELTYKRTRLAKLTERGLCHRCAKRSAVPGKTRCFECAEAQNVYCRTNADLKAAAARSKAARMKARADGKCGKCFKVKAIAGKTQCKGCFEKDRARSAISRAEKRKARLAKTGVVEREREEPGATGETERQRRARVKAEKDSEREKQNAQLPPPAELKSKMDEHNLSVRDYATLHGVPEAKIRSHLATIGVYAATRNGWQAKNDAKRALATGGST